MKPPKSIRNIVNTLLGKKSKLSAKDLKGLENDGHQQFVLDKNTRHHRSADDLLGEESAHVISDRYARSSLGRRSSSLPRRSQSCMSVRGHSQNSWEPIYGRRVVNGSHHAGEHGGPYNTETSARPSSNLSRPYSRNSSSNSSRSNFSRTRSFNENGRADRLSRTSSWSQPCSGNSRTVPSGDFSRTSSKQGFHNRQTNGSLSTSRRFPSAENILSNSSQRDRSSSASRSQREVTEEKLRTCLHVLDRLSAQVKEIKDVSKRVVYVDNKMKNGTMKRGELERRLRELDLAEAASQRLKSMLKSGVGEASSTRHSSLSSGYDSENSTGSRGSTFSQGEEIHRTSRPPSRISHSQRSALHLSGPTTAYQTSQPYPQSVSDMMTIWDAKDLGSHSSKPPGRRMTREDSASSGYATGSGSEDSRHDSPNCNDVDSVASVYSMQSGNPGYQRLEDANSHVRSSHHQLPQHFGGYPAQGYDAYAVYGAYPQHYPTPGAEEIYGNYGDVYGYATSSVYDHEIYSNGWYQLPTSGHSTADSYNNAAVLPPGPNEQGWGQVGYFTAQSGGNKHGGLSDLFYDPTAQSDVTLMETIAKEVASDSQNSADSSWKTYGSFRYRNGQRMITSSGGRKRKTVRFSQTVRQRVETEESEMEDSTSVIKGGEDNGTSDNSQELQNDDSGVYMMPRSQAGSIQSAVSVNEDATASQQNGLPEPIYEFPSGHIESSCMCGDCILARNTCQMQPTQALSYYQ